MDDLILAGAVSVIAVCTAALIVVIAAVFALRELFRAAAAGASGEIIIILVTCTLLISAYIGTGLWLQKCGRI